MIPMKDDKTIDTTNISVQKIDNINESDIDNALNILIQEKTIKKLEGSNPNIYYI